MDLTLLREIYQYKYKLIPAETLFIDDYPINVEGAKQVGMHALQFTNAKDCKKALIEKWHLEIK